MDPRNMLLADEALDAEGLADPPKPEAPLPIVKVDTSASANAYLEGRSPLVRPAIHVLTCPVLKQYSGQKVAVKLKEMELWAYSLGLRVGVPNLRSI